MTPTPPALPPIPTLRLPQGPAPTGYALELFLDPRQPTFRGVVDIAMTFPANTSFLWLNGKKLSVDTAEALVGKEKIPATSNVGGDSFIGFAFAKPVTGPATLHIVYRGQIDEHGGGIYSQHAGNDAYLFTQFESSDARRMVPSFDEPSYKVPWQISVHVPTGMPAFSNTNVVSDVEETAQGTHKITFGPTRPLPSYLLALVVGPMEIVDGGTAGAHKTPLHILVPHGMAAQGAFAAGIVGKLLSGLEGYFGVPFPYDKLDNAGRPEGLGAMENAGLIISGAGYLIAPPELQSVAFRRRTASVAAHEMAHQWFGDLVTMVWWDDIWLNEAFASWMTGKVFAVEKDWDPAQDRASARREAMEADTRTRSRQIRQPIESVADIENAFDAITYQKGETVLAMFERALGEEIFRAGVRKYLETHAYKNATTSDFVAAISAAAGHDVGPAFASFLDQPGLPAVNVDVKCAGGKGRVALAQERYLGAGAPTVAPASWRIPVCVAAHGKSGSKVVCSELADKTGEIALDECPGWIVANSGGTGYYLARYTADGTRALAAHVGELSVPEKLGLLTDLRVQLVGGTANVPAALDLVTRLAKAGPTPVVTEAANLAEALVARGIVGPEHEAAYATWLQKTFGARARSYGLQGKAGESADDKTARAALVPLVAIRGRDRALTDAAKALVLRWLEDRKAVEPDAAAPVLRVAAAAGDVAFADRLVAAAAKANGYDRTLLVAALFQMLDPEALARAATVIGTGELKAREVRFIAGREVSGPARPVIFHEVRANFAKLDGERAGGYLGSGEPLCDADSLREFLDFFADKAPKLRGGERAYALVVERVQTCIAARQASAAGLTAALKGAR